jgi:hypothetical protein
MKIYQFIFLERFISQRIYIIIMFILFSFLGHSQTGFQYKIYIPDSLDKTVMEAVNDMSSSLEMITGRKYKIILTSNRNVEGITFQRLAESGLQSSIKKQVSKDGQSFYLSVKGQTSALIIGTGKNSFLNGIYTFLNELGFRWYMPGEAWTIVPKRLKPEIRIEKVYTPDFQNRVYAGTGGVNGIIGLDPTNEFKKDYDLWNRRNRISADYISHGHTGQAFYTANKKDLDMQPSYSCNGKINPYGRIDISKKEAVDLFTQWALGQVRKGEPYPSIGVDPADGSGGKDDCLPSGMPSIKTWSDKYFWLANKVAEKLPANSNVLVQLYAYSDHAATPSFDLHENVYPIIIPYGFQNVSTPQEFIKNWHLKLKGRLMGIYDYWNITQWSVSTPQFNIFSIPGKLRFWKDNSVTTVHLETTTGKGAMGHSFWLAFQMMWNTEHSFDSLYNEFLSDCFGPAANDIKRMYNRWSLNYQQAMDVNLSLNDLASAASKIKDAKIQAKITELKAYVHYLKLYYDYRSNSTVQSYNEIINYLYLIHPLRLVQTSALVSYYIKPPKDYNAPIPNNQRESAVDLSKLYREIESNFKADLNKRSFTYSIASSNFNIVKAKPIVVTKAIDLKYLNGPNQYQFYLPASKTFSIKMGSTKQTRMRVLNDEGEQVFEKNILPSEEDYISVKVQLPAGKYTLLLGAYYQFTRIEFPTDMVFVSSGTLWYSNASYPLLYVYVPKDIDVIVYEDMLGPGLNKRGYWIDPSGKRIEAENIYNNIYKVSVPKQYRGYIWTLNIGHPSFKLLNIPNSFSLNKFSYNEN